ncbi:MAG: glycosyltransferase family 4 protein [Erythrobacter sp.]|uniref:glycosyltransferase family 4 protein n=1 Tax=Erythrobacter sp. TaxID=1042 RepID=UPI003A86A9ED
MTAMPTDLPTSTDKASGAARVLFITRKWGPAVGGMETYSERLSEELARLHPLDVIALKGRDNGLPPTALALLLFPFAVLRRLFALRDAPAIIHCGDMAIWPLGLMARAFFPKARLVLSAHGTDVSYGLRGGFLGSAYEAYQKLGARLLGRAGVIANSHATHDRLKDIGWQPRAVVPLATDLRGSPPASFDPDTILFAGRLITQKGCSWFVREVMPLLPETMRLTVIGTRWDASEDAVLDFPRVNFLGPMPQTELARHFGTAGCVVMPNIERANGEFEGFGLIAPEAASVGGVVVAAATGGLKDAVINGETGFLLPPGDAKAWADRIIAIREWSAKARADFVAQSQLAAQRHFSWRRVAEATAQAYVQ